MFTCLEDLHMKKTSTVVLIACAVVGILALLSSNASQAANSASQGKGVHAQPKQAAGCTPTPTPTPPE